MDRNQVTWQLLVLAVLLGGCSKPPVTPGGAPKTTMAPWTSPPASAPAPTKVRVAYGGFSCEAPTLVAYEKGFWRDEGLDVELVKIADFDATKQGLTLGKIDAAQLMAMSLVKPLEQGLDVRVSAGLHTGCIKILAPVKSDIKGAADLKGKRIGVPSLGDSAYTFATRVLATNGLDPSKDVTFRVFPAAELELALKKGEIDAVAVGEPIGVILEHSGVCKVVVNMAKDKPFADEYCCLVTLNAKVAANTELASKITRGFLKGAKWTSVNSAAAAKLEVDAKYVATTVEYNTAALGELNFVPSVVGAELALSSSAAVLKKLGILSADTDPAKLAKNAIASLPGIDEKWIRELAVDKVAAAPAPADPMARLTVADAPKDCCPGGPTS